MLYGGPTRIDNFKNSIGFEKSCLMEYSMSIERKVLYGVLQKFDIWRTPYPKKNFSLGSTPGQCNYLRYGFFQKYQVLRTPCPFVNFTTWRNPYTCKNMTYGVL